MTDCCPLCGSVLRVERIYWDVRTRAVIGNGHVRQLTPKQGRLFEALWPPKGEYRKAEELAAELYPTFYRSPHGGVPLISSLAKRLRKILAPLNIHVEGSRARDRGGFRIVMPKSLTQRQNKTTDRRGYMRDYMQRRRASSVAGVFD